MANLMGRYHDDLQNRDPIENEREYKKDLKRVLSHIKVKIGETHAEMLATNITREEVREAIEELPNSKAAGLDGIPQEIWKSLLDTTGKSDSEEERNSEEVSTSTYDVADYLTAVYNNIENHGVTENTGFADGWLCLIYKKGDRADAGNYRPITVLNTDYKTFTKILTKKLAKVAPEIIHPDQAGFMKNQRIEDQMELPNLVIAWG